MLEGNQRFNLIPCGYDRTNDCIPEGVPQLASTSLLKEIVGGKFGLVQQFCLWQQLRACHLPSLPPQKPLSKPSRKPSHKPSKKPSSKPRQ
jgi:hypothetical protein